MQANFEDFMMYIYKNLIEFNIKEDLSNQLNMLEGKVPTNYYLKLLEEITSQIYANLQAIKINFDNKSYVFDELNKMQNANYENLLKEDYKDFTKESFETDEKILEELINVMTSKYGFENAKKSIIKYQKSIKESEKDQGKKIEYITRENNIREKIIKSKSFTTYMSSFKEEDLKKIIDSLKPKLNEKSKEKIKTKKEMILEEVCRETYLAFQNENRNFSGKLQVARALIRMENGDYSPITRRNNARLIAEENIKMDEVLDIIKKTLERKGYIIENHQDLYELYAMHIEYLCQK